MMMMMIINDKSKIKESTKRIAVCSATTAAAADAADASGENAAVVNTIKAIFGAGGFALPWAFAQGGTVLVTACLLSSLVLSMETLRMLVAAQDVVVSNNTASESDVSTYAGLTKVALGAFGENLNKTLNVVTCFGITVSYLLFISETAVAMFPAATAATITKVQAVSAITPLVLGLSWIRNMAGVNIISLVGTCSVALGMLVCAVSAATKISMPASLAAIPVANVAAFPGFFGTVAFLFFIHFTLFGIQQGMPQKEKFLGAASKAFVLSAIVGGIFGIICAVGFGPNVSSVVITMLEGPIGVFVKGLLCVKPVVHVPNHGAIRACCVRIGLHKQRSGERVGQIAGVDCSLGVCFIRRFVRDVDSELWRRSRVRRRRVLLRDDARVTAGDFRQVFEESGSSSQLCG